MNLIPEISFSIIGECLCEKRPLKCYGCSAYTCEIHANDNELCRLCHFQFYAISDIAKTFMTNYSICIICDNIKPNDENSIESYDERICFGADKKGKPYEGFICDECFADNYDIKNHYSNKYCIYYKLNTMSGSVFRITYDDNIKNLEIIETARKKRTNYIRKESSKYLLYGLANLVAEYCGYIRKIECHPVPDDFELDD